MFYAEWTDQWAAKKLEGVRDESGYLSRWFGGGAESTAGKYSKLKGEAVEVQTYAVPPRTWPMTPACSRPPCPSASDSTAPPGSPGRSRTTHCPSTSEAALHPSGDARIAATHTLANVCRLLAHPELPSQRGIRGARCHAGGVEQVAGAGGCGA